MKKLFQASLIAAAVLLGACGGTGHNGTSDSSLINQTSAESAALRSRIQVAATRQGVTDLSFEASTDGGLLVNGRLGERLFALRFPPAWNSQTVLFAHGYVAFDEGKADEVARDPVTSDPSAGLLPGAYRQGFAVGHTSYDKTGFAITSAMNRTVALKRFTDEIGSQRAFITGGSMGGSITALLSQRYPTDFAGAIAICGVVSDWTYLLDYVSNVRVLYNYFAANTAYALPGSKDVTKSVGALTNAGISLTLLKLQADMEAQPSGQAAAIMARTLSAVPGVRTQADLVTLFSAISLNANGMDDFKAQMGGLPIDNSTTVYQSTLLSAEQNAALNAGVQRYAADPGVRDRVVDQFSTTGTQPIKLLTVSNAYDSLVPYENEERFRSRVAAGGTLSNLAQRTVPTLDLDLSDPAILKVFPALGNLKGPLGALHCGFKPEQMDKAWKDMQAWVEQGVKPVESFRVDLRN